MADGLVQVQPDSTGKMVDTTELVVGPNTVERQRAVVAGAAAAELADVKNADPAANAYGLVARLAGVPPGCTSFNATHGAGAKGTAGVRIDGTFVGTRRKWVLIGNPDPSFRLVYGVTGFDQTAGKGVTLQPGQWSPPLPLDTAVQIAACFPEGAGSWDLIEIGD